MQLGVAWRCFGPAQCAGDHLSDSLVCVAVAALLTAAAVAVASEPEAVCWCMQVHKARLWWCGWSGIRRCLRQERPLLPGKQALAFPVLSASSACTGAGSMCLLVELSCRADGRLSSGLTCVEAGAGGCMRLPTRFRRRCGASADLCCVCCWRLCSSETFSSQPAYVFPGQLGNGNVKYVIEVGVGHCVGPV
jgi:hypothetical protein